MGFNDLAQEEGRCRVDPNANPFAPISRNRSLGRLFADLLDQEGSEIYLMPADRCVRKDVDMDWRTVVAVGVRRGEIPIRYRQSMRNACGHETFEIVTDPLKDAIVACRPGDRLIVVAEEP